MTFGDIFLVFSAVHPRDLVKQETQQICSECRIDSHQYGLKPEGNAPLSNAKMLLPQTVLKAKRVPSKLRAHRTK